MAVPATLTVDLFYDSGVILMEKTAGETGCYTYLDTLVITPRKSDRKSPEIATIS
jgi:hypothetical protein